MKFSVLLSDLRDSLLKQCQVHFCRCRKKIDTVAAGIHFISRRRIVRLKHINKDTSKADFMLLMQISMENCI